MAKYKLQSDGVLREDGAYIPECEANSDWKEYQAWLAVEGNIPDSQYAPGEELATQLAAIRSLRDSKLAASDFTQMPDYPISAEDKASWAAHRQLLRDFPTACDPASPVWPTEPA